MTNTCILDIGANNGDFLFKIAERCPSIPVIGFEPIPELYDGLAIKKETLGLTNVDLMQTAVNTNAGVAKFNVARHADWGISSLLEIDSSSVSKNEYWSKRPDIYFDQSIEVNVQRLDEILLASGYDHVSFIKIDAQGVDLKVLESLGSFLANVDAGMLEAPTTSKSALYSNESNLHEVLNFLEKNGFEPYAIKPNDPACNEVNIFFNRVGLDWQEIESRLNLRGIPLYDGKHYWHIPSAEASATATEAASISIQHELSRARHIFAENSAAWTRVAYWKNEASVLQQKADDLSSALKKYGLDLGDSPNTADATDTAGHYALLRQQNIALKSEIAAIHQSTSWKVTAILRAIRKLI